jgi:hypothetical protein
MHLVGVHLQECCVAHQVFGKSLVGLVVHVDLRVGPDVTAEIVALPAYNLQVCTAILQYTLVLL